VPWFFATCGAQPGNRAFDHKVRIDHPRDPSFAAAKIIAILTGVEGSRRMSVTLLSRLLQTH